MSLSLNNSLNTTLDTLNLAIEESIRLKVEAYKASNGLMFDPDFELPAADLSDCDVEIISLDNGDILTVTTYHNLEAFEKELTALNAIKDLGVHVADRKNLTIGITVNVGSAIKVMRSIKQGHIARIRNK